MRDTRGLATGVKHSACAKKRKCLWVSAKMCISPNSPPLPEKKRERKKLKVKYPTKLPPERQPRHRRGKFRKMPAGQKLAIPKVRCNSQKESPQKKFPFKHEVLVLMLVCRSANNHTLVPRGEPAGDWFDPLPLLFFSGGIAPATSAATSRWCPPGPYPAPPHWARPSPRLLLTLR